MIPTKPDDLNAEQHGLLARAPRRPTCDDPTDGSQRGLRPLLTPREGNTEGSRAGSSRPARPLCPKPARPDPADASLALIVGDVEGGQRIAGRRRTNEDPETPRRTRPPQPSPCRRNVARRAVGGTRWRWWELAVGEVTADPVDHRRTVRVSPWVPTPPVTSGARSVLLFTAAFSLIPVEWHAPAGRADKTVMELLDQAPDLLDRHGPAVLLWSRTPVRSRASASPELDDESPWDSQSASVSS